MKRRWTLLPWRALGVCVDVMTGHGADKYEPDHWKTLTVKDHLDAAMRHLTAYLGGEPADPSSKLPHLAHFACRALMALGVSGGLPVTIICSEADCGAKADALDGRWRCAEHHARRNLPPPLPTKCPHCGGVFGPAYTSTGISVHLTLCPAKAFSAACAGINATAARLSNAS